MWDELQASRKGEAVRGIVARVSGGRVTGLGHAFLAEIRGVTYRRSLPLATGHLPIVLSELGNQAGVIGAARLASEAVYTPLGKRAT